MLGFKKGGNFKDSNFFDYGRFGIPPLALGSFALWFAVRAVIQFPDEGQAWYGLTLSATMTGCGLGTTLYGLWLDWRQRRRSK